MDDPIDRFYESRFEDKEDWIEDYNKKRCPKCSAVQDTEADICSVCDWRPER